MKKVALLFSFMLVLFTLSSNVPIVTAEVSSAWINAGGADFTAADGNLYVADKEYVVGDFGYSGGRTFSFATAIDGTTDDTLYQTVRSAYSMSYLFDVPAGDYEVTLHFMEPWQSAAGERLFDVTMEGAVLLASYDIFAAAGGQFTAVTETFTVNVSDGTLNIDIDRISRVALVSAISVVSGTPPTPEPEISVSPTNLDFGDVVESTDSDMTVTITNDGTADLNVSSLATSNGLFTVVSPTAPVVILPGNNEIVTIRFSPTGVGAQSGSLDIDSDDADEATVSVSLDGNGVVLPPDDPDISVSTTALDFGNVTPGNTADQIVTISNDGTQILTVSDLVSSNGLFTIVSPAMPVDVAVGGSQDVTVRFSPTVDGIETGDLTITSNDPDEGSLIVSLTGTGLSTPATAQRINSAGADFTDGNGDLFVADKAYVVGDFGYSGNGRVFSFADDILNTTDDALYQSVRSSLTMNYLFDVPDGEYEVTLYFMEPFQSGVGEREFDVTIEDVLALDDYDIVAASGGQFTAVSETIIINVSDGTLNIDFDRVNRVAMVSAVAVVSTSGTPPTPEPEITITPTSLDFSDVVESTDSDMTVTITNDGTADLNVSSLTTTNGLFSVVSPTAPLVIAAGNNELVTVRFSPIAAGAQSGSLDIASDDADEPTVSITLDGNGVDVPPTDPDISLSTTSLAFGSVTIGNTADQIVTISNVGTVTLTVSSLTTDNGTFTVESPVAPVDVAPNGGTQDVTVRFTPTVSGSEVGDLTIVSDDPDEGSVTAALSGTGATVGATIYSDATAQVGMTLNHTIDATLCEPPIGSGSAWADYDNDGDIDFFATNHGGANWFYRNDGDTNSDGLPDYTDVAASLGLDDPTGNGHSAVFIDYDNDGDQDLYVTNWDGNNLYENQLVGSGSVSFIDVTATAGIGDGGRAITSAWADFDNDGWLDLYVTKHAYCGGDPQSQDHLFQSNGDGTFSDATSYLCAGASTCTQVEGLGFSPGFFDMDNDGDLDLYLVNDNLGGTNQPNQMWRNDGSDGSGGWIFTDVAVAAGTQLDVNGMGLSIGDYDNDGWLDLAFSDLSPAHLLNNNGDGTFADVSDSSGVTAVTTDDVTWGTVFLDHDNDGWLDLFYMAGNIHQPAADDPNVFMVNNGDGTFSDASVGSGLDDMGRGRSASLVDFDQDGFVDLFAGNYGQPSHLFHNDSGAQGNTNHWLTITVEGTDSNRDGIGTRIFLTAGGITQMREINSGPTHGGGDYRAAYFGLAAETSGTLTIEWPNGITENVGTVTADQAMHRIEPLLNPPATTYVDIALDAGITHAHSLGAICDPPISNGSAWADYDNDGDIDLFTTNHGGANWLYRNDGDTDFNGAPNFTDVASAMGVDDAAGISMSAVFIDYDNDGDQDLYVTNWDDDPLDGTFHGNVLYENQLIETGSVAFVDISATAGISDWGRAITSAWADVDEDGLLDFYIAKHKRCGAFPDAQDHLFKNNGDGTFTDVTSWLCGGLSTCDQVEGLGFSPAFFDYDNDGDLDLYLVNDIIGGDFRPNVLWRNDGSDGSGGWILTDVSAAAGVEIGLNGMGLGVGDIDNDGWLDLAFSNIGPAALMQNNGDGTFSDGSSATGVSSLTTGTTWATAFFDYDNDGWLDLYYVSGQLHDTTEDTPNIFMSNDGDGTFTSASISSGLDSSARARSMSIVDFDQDGLVDVFVPNYGSAPILYHNRADLQGNGNHWLNITVEGTESNRDGIGTRLILTAGGVTQIREINTGPTHGGGDYRAAYFGLGSELSGTLMIQWPNGVVQNLGSITADQNLHFVEPSSIN